MNRKTILFLLFGCLTIGATAQTTEAGGITPEMLKSFRTQTASQPSATALRNALAGTAINQLAKNPNNPDAKDTYFSNDLPSKGITDQESSGRCWLFTGLNVMRSAAIRKHNLGEFTFSQSYNFFYDQLEKSNLFLQSVIDCAKLPQDDRKVEWLFKNPLSDGGTFCGVIDMVGKYGVVPSEVMPESFNANNTSRMSNLLQTKLREYGLTLRKAYAKGESTKALQKRKTEMLSTIYRILTICLGEPVQSFEWTRRDASGKPLETKTYTPQEFYQEYVGTNLRNTYVMLMNDPSRPFHKTYTVDLDRHSYDGLQWTYLNLPIDEIRDIAIASIKDSTMMYFSCDVGKQLNSERGLLDVNNYDYASLMGVTFGMDKKQRIATFSSGSSHAMTLVGVDLDKDGKPLKWLVENSWGAASGWQGHLIMTDEWFNEYMFRLVVETKYVPAKVMQMLKQKPIKLPAWDPMFAEEQ